MLEGLRRNGVEVIECHEPLWQGIEDRIRAASGGWLQPVFITRVARTYWRLLRAYRKVTEYDVMVLGYPGQLDVYLARLLTWLRGKPLVLDVFMSIYLIAQERELTVQHPITGRLIYWLEKLALLLPDRLIQDTAEYVEWFQRTYGLDPNRFRLVPTGADDRLFRPLPVTGNNNGVFRALYYGTFIPNHGIEQIIEAARILQDRCDIRFELVGEGPAKPRALALVQAYGLTNVTFVDWIDRDKLPHRVAEADVLLGAFGITPQSLMTIQNKIYEGLAMAKPVVTGDSPAVRSQLENGTVVLAVERGNAQALAQALLTLHDDPTLRDLLATRGHRLFAARFSTMRVGEQVRQHLGELLSTQRQPAKGKPSDRNH